MKNIPVYDKTASYARENNELETYRTSKKANMACKTAISDAIRKNYNNNTLDTKTALNELTESFSLERIAIIAAVSLRYKDWDGRISSENKAWSKAFPFPKDIDDWGIDRNIVYAISETHPGLLDLFANAVRKELELTKTIPLKKPSLFEKLNRPLPQKTDKGSNSKEQEL